jgi:hypothetical protein
MLVNRPVECDDELPKFGALPLMERKFVLVELLGVEP